MKATRQTRQRQAVLEALRSTRTHPDAAWIFQEVRQALPSISLGTVYRALDALSKEGAVTVIERAGERARYDFKHEDHHHAVCRSCGAIFDIEVVSVPRGGQLPAGFEVTDVVLEFHGVCAACRGSKL